ncbi:hypothetical protein [Staphylococcus massiliensis]|uniref:Lipoprotein n=1 Tax=Staphylococcus massiliensis S46 TaxID=1229783 RepID=K9AWC5_9STAP|nr:hypothetical protein [Staphylococcus massiliensis]EKU50366.1 hypothetical protein C273_00045 [Staphylococcus massiliensis S46]
MKRLLISISVCTLLATGCGKQDKDASQQQGETKEAKSNNIHNDQKFDYSKLSDKDKQHIKQTLIDFTAKEEAKNGLAVSNRFFGSGSFQEGDWYANTTDGQVQVSNRGEPGPKAFKIHKLAGVVVYKSKDGTKGFDKKAEDLSNVEGYNKVANMKEPIKKFIFADNGKVYAFTFKPDVDTRPSSGFAPKDYTEQDENLTAEQVFEVKESKTYTKKLKSVMSQYASK